MDFVAAVVVDEGAPIGMSALARVGVLVKMSAVELGEAVSVPREVRGSPVEDDSDAGLVAAVHEFHEFCGWTEAAGGAEVAERLIAPGSVVRMLHDREQLDVRVAKLFDIRDQLVGKLAVTEPAIVLLGEAAPGTEMDFVNGDGGLEPIFLCALRNPIGVVPLIGVEPGDDGASIGPKLGAKAVGIGFEREDVAVRPDDFVFVDGSFRNFREKNFPDTRRTPRAHGMDATVPAIEIANDAHAPGAGSPNSEVNATEAFEGNEMSAEFFVGVVMAAFAHEVQIELAENVRKSVGIVNLKGRPIVCSSLDFVTARGRSGGSVGRPSGFEETLGVELHGVDDLSRRGGSIRCGSGFENDAGLRGPREKKPHNAVSLKKVRAEKGKGIGVAPGDQRIDLGAKAELARSG